MATKTKNMQPYCVRENKISVSSSATTSDSDETNHMTDDDNERFYDAIEDTVTLINNLSLGNQRNENEDFVDSIESLEGTDSSIASPNANCSNNNNNSTSSGAGGESEDALLETPWTFWFDRCIPGTSMNEYAAGLKFIYKVETAQQFWRVFNNIPDVANLPNRCSYHLMRGSRKPLWEDQENVTGGQWKIKCHKSDTSLVWRETLLAAIGEQFSDNVAKQDEIVGVSVSCREKDDIIQIWNLNALLESEATILKKVQELVPKVIFPVKFYKAHVSHDAFEGSQHHRKSHRH